jgi:hypothetical protein
MEGDEYSLDHFLPWCFVAHDNLWNIVPTPRRVNSAKGDRVPDFETYFDRFARRQFKAMQVVVSANTHHRLLEDYLFLLSMDSVAGLATLSLERFAHTLHAAIAPQAQIAINLGFEGGWIFDPTHLPFARESL